MWRMTKKMKKNKRGSILPFAVVLVILLFVMGLALTRLGLNARMAAARTTAEISARAAADAGFAQAIRLMNKSLAKKPWDGTPIPAVSDVMLSGSDARYSYNVTKKGTYYQVASTGESGIAQRKVYGILTLESLLSGIGVKKVIDLKVGVTFSAKPKSRFAMRTNSIEDNAIILKSGVTIPGDVICGPGGDPDEVINVKSTTTILGDSYAAQSEIDFPPVVLPDDIKNVPLTPYTYSPGSPIVGSADPNNPMLIKFDSIKIPTGGVQQIKGCCEIYVVGNTILGQSAEFIITEGSSLHLYLGNNMEAKNSNGIDNLNFGNPEALRIYGLDTCQSIDLKAKGDIFFGYVYAPEADLNVYAKNEISGAFVGKSFTLKNSTKFTYIPPKGSGGLKDPTSYLMLRWWEE